MAVTARHVMDSNARLLRQLERDIFQKAESAWVKVYSQFCKKHGALDPNKIMQFKYQGQYFKLAEDVAMRSGVRPLHPELVPEFEGVFKMFVTEVNEEKRIFQNMLSHAIRIAKYEEDLLDLLPPIMHASITEAGFFQMEHKPMMSVAQADEFKRMYEPYFSLFDERVVIGALM